MVHSRLSHPPWFDHPSDSEVHRLYISTLALHIHNLNTHNARQLTCFKCSSESRVYVVPAFAFNEVSCCEGGNADAKLGIFLWRSIIIKKNSTCSSSPLDLSLIVLFFTQRLVNISNWVTVAVTQAVCLMQRWNGRFVQGVTGWYWHFVRMT